MKSSAVKKEVIIIGGGPAGISAAIQLKRYGIDICIFEKDEIGGMVFNANLIENYLGFPNGIKGIDFKKLILKQFNKLKIDIYSVEVIKINREKSYFNVFTKSKKYSCNNLIIATGTIPVKIPFESDKIYYDIKHLINVNRKNIIVIGSGDIAFDYALTLSKNNKITIITRNNIIKCINSLKEKVLKNSNISIKQNLLLINAVNKNNKLLLEFYNSKENKNEILNSDILLAAIGRKPNIKLISKYLKKKFDNLYFAGDVVHPGFRQVSIACGDGIKTAMEIFNKINN